MATYYNYAERSADSQVNWAEVGKGISDMLKDEVKIREDKKAAYNKAYQTDMQELANAPQGKWQDGNATVNNFAHDMMEQQMIDNRLLKSGQMKERDYTLRRENYKSQTNTLFDLQKTFQSERQSTIEQYQAGELQGMNISNMSDVEAYTDFANAKAIIDPYAANISMAIYNTETVDGKEVRVVKKSTPVNVLRGQIVQKIPTFKVDEAVAKDVKSLGVDYNFIYDAATKTKAGTITELIGYGALQGEYSKKDKNGKPLHPEFATSVKKIDDAIDQTVNKYFSNPYNISSVLTENTGNYSAESYTWDKDEASKDKTKLLKKINPLTGMTILDEDAPHYKEQLNEARDWVKKRILGELDSKRTIKEVGTIPYGPQPQQWQVQGAQDKKNELAAAGAWNQLYTGKTAAEKQAAADILLGTPQAQAQGLLGIDLSTAGTVKLSYADSKKNRSIAIWDANKKPISLYDFAGKGVELHGVVDRQQAVKAGGGGTGYGALTDADWKSVKSVRTGEAASAPVVNILPELFSIRSGPSTKSLQNLLGPTFKVTDMGGPFGNDVEVIAPNGQKFTYNANLKKDEAAVAKADLEQFIKVNGAPVGNTGGGGVNYGDK